MAPPATSKGKRPAPADPDSDVEAGGLSPSAPSSNKRRRRANGHADSDDSDAPVNGQGGEEEDDDEDDIQSNPDEDTEKIYEERGRNFKPDYQRGEDGYVAGSIVRIKMVNFMTYDHVEFSPGPHLNMILGPNGTGKSSIAASIAIGLGFPPKVMGRDKDTASYVKQGADDTELEIELKGRIGEPNTVIHRKFGRNSKSSDWSINGESCTRTKVQETVRSFGVQASNLCTFLPQDKVAEFAKMSPETVLQATMAAAGDPRLGKWHEKLVAVGDKVKTVENRHEVNVDNQKRLQNLVDSLVPDVQHVQEREAKEQELEVLTHLVKVKDHARMQAEVALLGKSRQTLKARINHLNSKRQPLRDLEEKWRKKAAHATGKVQKTSDNIRSDLKKLAKLNVDHGKAADKIVDVNNELSALRSEVEKRDKNIKEAEKKLGKARRILDQPREDTHDAVRAKNSEKSDIDTDLRETTQMKVDAQDQYASGESSIKRIEAEIQRKTSEKGTIDNARRFREQKARTWDSNIGFMLDWLKQNGNSLEGEVHPPPTISVNVADRSVAQQVEQCVNASQLKTFICTNNNDYRRLLKLNNTPTPKANFDQAKVNKSPKVQMNIAYQEVTPETFNPPRGCSLQQLQECGFKGWAIDFMEAPDAVLAFLQMQAHCHQAAVTDKPATECNTEPLPRFGLRSWATRADYSTARQAQYGRRDFTTATLELKKCESFNVVVDQAAVDDINREITSLEQEKSDLQRAQRDRTQAIDALRQKIKQLNDKKNAISEEIRELREISKKYARAESDVVKYQEEIERIQALPSVDARREELKRNKLRAARDCMRPLAAYMDVCGHLVDECINHIGINFLAIQSGANQATVEDKLKAQNGELTELRTKYQDVVDGVAALKAETHRALKSLSDDLKAASRDVRQEVTRRSANKAASLPDLVVLQDQVNELKAALEMAVHISPNVVERFEKLSKELEEVNAVVDNEAGNIHEMRTTIKDTLGMFEPALQLLVNAVSERFSIAFAKRGCSGEVQIMRNEESYARWGLEILVSFRSESKMEVLTGSHQSGGERALATITYLMSLSEMSRTPFSLVDEINQGMDPTAERGMHNQLVDVTCEADAGQYFLITPKLLTNLNYHPRMKVLVINNGADLPDSYDLSQRYGNLKGCLAKYRQSHGLVAAH
ncbi:hypothetical protein IAT38_003170 [Cryptococcus sp. DSM 104549]